MKPLRKQRQGLLRSERTRRMATRKTVRAGQVARTSTAAEQGMAERITPACENLLSSGNKLG